MNPDIELMNPQRVRTKSPLKLLRLFIISGLLLIAAGNANALDIAEWRFQTSIYTHHWSSDPDHVSNSKLLGIEFETTTRWIGGFAYFDNSFGQPSQYLYAGYKDPYEDKIPLNGLGIAPAIVPAFGFKYKRVLSEIQILGTAAVTLTVGFNFGHKSD